MTQNKIENMHSIKFKFKMGFEDIKEFTSYNIKKSFIYKLSFIYGLFFIPISLLGFFSTETYWLGWFGISYILLLFLYYPLLIKHKAKTNLQTEASYEHEIYYSINEDGFSVKGFGFEGNMHWKSLYKIIELKNIFVLYSNKYVASIIPKRALSEIELNELRNILKAMPNYLKK